MLRFWVIVQTLSNGYDNHGTIENGCQRIHDSTISVGQPTTVPSLIEGLTLVTRLLRGPRRRRKCLSSEPYQHDVVGLRYIVVYNRVGFVFILGLAERLVERDTGSMMVFISSWIMT